MRIIERYFAEELVEKDLRNFLTKLEKNRHLKKEFEEYKKINDYIGTNGNKISDDLEIMKDFKFDPEIYLDILKYGGPLRSDEEDIDMPDSKPDGKSS